jgi:hypothetical protein
LIEDDLVAIVGIACRVSMASNSESFWKLFSNGESAIIEVPLDRRDSLAGCAVRPAGHRLGIWMRELVRRRGRPAEYVAIAAGVSPKNAAETESRRMGGNSRDEDRRNP